ncbi:MAG: hypothetical protein DHS20C18_52150 [Saprospiraceae bacterium]|nr:MAG: hypothetical protein DHS20C18_52150 [Saprospiraceae bacterium]
MSNKKSTKKAAVKNKIDFSDSIKSIKNTATTLNAKVRETAVEVVEDIKENGKQLKEITVTPVKAAYENAYQKISETMTIDTVLKTTKSVNDYALKTTEEVIEGVTANGEKWQGVAAKAVKGGLKLASKQQDIVFDTLEMVKGQLSEGANRFKKLYATEGPQVAGKSTKQAKKKGEVTIDDIL